MQSLGIDNGLYMVAEGSCGRIEINTAEVIVDGVELRGLQIPSYGTSSTEID